jgi:hypothetical protein
MVPPPWNVTISRCGDTLADVLLQLQSPADPTHPLFGRRFAVLSVTRNPRGPVFVFVAYRDALRLRIPISSTNLAPSQIRPLRTKWTREAAQEILSLVTEGDTSCHKPGTSGEDSLKP